MPAAAAPARAAHPPGIQAAAPGQSSAGPWPQRLREGVPLGSPCLSHAPPEGPATGAPCQHGPRRAPLPAAAIALLVPLVCRIRAKGRAPRALPVPGGCVQGAALPVRPLPSRPLLYLLLLPVRLTWGAPPAGAYIDGWGS